ncbi:RNase H family protein, partial [Mesorhizobium sp.]
RHQVIWHWVKGHAGHPENERADELARLGMAPFKNKTARPAPVSAGENTQAKQPAARKLRRSTQSY